MLNLVPGQPLSHGGFRWAQTSRCAEAEALNLLATGKRFSLALCRTVDPEWKLASQFSLEGRKLAVSEGELLDLGLA